MFEQAGPYTQSCAAALLAWMWWAALGAGAATGLRKPPRDGVRSSAPIGGGTVHKYGDAKPAPRWDRQEAAPAVRIPSEDRGIQEAEAGRGPSINHATQKRVEGQSNRYQPLHTA